MKFNLEISSSEYRAVLTALLVYNTKDSLALADRLMDQHSQDTADDGPEVEILGRIQW